MTDSAFYADAKFISDQPTAVDGFRTRSHKRVADMLVAIIARGSAGRAIGLEGTWGSGKSSVIDIASKGFADWNLKNAVKHSVFVFDAWAHQGDPVRRVFLEEPIDHLLSDGALTQPKKWEEKKEGLRSLRKKTEETRYEKLSWVARTALLALPLYPLAFVLIAKSIDAANPNSTAANTNDPKVALPIFGEWEPWVAFTVGAVIVAAPYVVALITRLRWWSNPEKRHRSVIWAFNKQTDHVTTEQLIREDEATTVEFNSVFDEIAKNAGENHWSLTIVVDNLDRLTRTQIRDIWAIMRNFFAATPGSRRRAALSNVHLVVPIDRNHIETVFEDDSAKASGFVEKTFEIVLRVPPPLLSNWRDFLSEKLQEAFGEKISSKYRVFHLFELFQTENAGTVTPRALISFVNSLVAQAKLAGNEIPLEYQALFVLYKNKIASNVEALQDSSILSSSIRATLSDPEWATYLAACHFGAPVGQALELLLGRDIEKALLDRDPKKLQDLQQTHGFDTVLHGVIARRGGEWATENPTILLDAAATINSVNLANAPAENEIWDGLARSVPNIGISIVPTESTPTGIGALLSRLPRSQMIATARKLKEALMLERSDLVNNADAVGKSWYLMLEAIAAAVADDKTAVFGVEAPLAIPIQANVPLVLSVAEAAFGSRELSFREFSPRTQPDEISTATMEFVAVADPPPRLEKIVGSLLQLPTAANWKALANGIQSRLSQNNPTLTAGTALRLFSLLSIASRKQERAKRSLKAICDDGTAHGLIELGRKESSPRLIGLALFHLIEFRGSTITGPTEHSQFGNLAPANEYIGQLQSAPSSNEQIVDAVASAASEVGGYGDVLKRALPPEGNRELPHLVLQSMTRRGLFDGVSPIDVATNADEVQALLGDELFDKLATHLSQTTTWHEITKEKWRLIQPALLNVLNRSSSPSYGVIVEQIREGLLHLATTEWTEILAKEGNELALTFKLIEDGNLAQLETGFADALESYFGSLLSGASGPNKFASKWQELPGALSSSRRPHFFKSVRDLILNKNPSLPISRMIVALLGESFLENADLAEREDDVVRVLIEPSIRDAGEESLQFLELHSKNLGDIVRGATSHNKQYIADRIEAVVSDIGATSEKAERLRHLESDWQIGGQAK